MKLLEFEPAPLWEDGPADGGFTHYTLALVSQIMYYILGMQGWFNFMNSTIIH